jgi:Pyruvate/2-oxoacid:ferredoxin oxidoreductase delta subunit
MPEHDTAKPFAVTPHRPGGIEVCEFCVQHGEGKKWYLQAKNYSAELMNLKRLSYGLRFISNVEKWATSWALDLDQDIAADPSSKDEYIAKRTAEFKREHYGQVIPLEDVYRILDMTTSIVRIPCACRSTLLGRYDARYCYLVTTFMPRLAKIGRLYPDFSSDLETLGKDDAKKGFAEHDLDGFVHTVWTFITPFTGVLCNCSSRECFPLMWRLRRGMPLFFKAEYVAEIDPDLCSGCRSCMDVCSFEAIDYDAGQDKCTVDGHRCYGCGVCRAACPHEAITLLDRNLIPALAEVW